MATARWSGDKPRSFITPSFAPCRQSMRHRRKLAPGLPPWGPSQPRRRLPVQTLVWVLAIVLRHSDGEPVFDVVQRQIGSLVAVVPSRLTHIGERRAGQPMHENACRSLARSRLRSVGVRMGPTRWRRHVGRSRARMPGNGTPTRVGARSGGPVASPSRGPRINGSGLTPACRGRSSD